MLIYLIFKIIINGIIVFAFLGTIICCFLQKDWTNFTKEFLNMITWLILANTQEIIEFIRERRRNEDNN